MPKLKSNSGAKKRFRFTGSGKIRRFKAFKSHILTKKSSKRKRALRQGAIIPPSFQKKAARMLGH